MKVIRIYTDGSVKNEGTKCAVGHLVIQDKTILCENVKVINQKLTSNQAEFTAFISSLNWLRSNGYSKHRVYVYVDNQNIQTGFYKRDVKGWNYSSNPYWEKIRAIRNEFPSLYVQWVPSHSYDVLNRRVDELCRTALLDNSKLEDICLIDVKQINKKT